MVLQVAMRVVPAEFVCLLSSVVVLLNNVNDSENDAGSKRSRLDQIDHPLLDLPPSVSLVMICVIINTYCMWSPVDHCGASFVVIDLWI